MGLQIDSEFANCSECGALSRDGLTCQERLYGLLAQERDNPELQAVHFLTVAAYNIQHPAQFMDDAIAGLRKSLVDYLEGKIDVHGVRERTKEFNGPRRVLKPVFERHPILVCWKTTTADVYVPADPLGAASRVKAWAESIKTELHETEQI
jgi:hypothetical protein